jgi:hypothetical protein
MGCELDGPGSIGTSDFSLLHSVQTGSAAHTASHPMGTGGSSSGVKRLVREADDSLPSTDEVKNVGAVSPLPHTSSWRGA